MLIVSKNTMKLQIKIREKMEKTFTSRNSYLINSSEKELKTRLISDAEKISGITDYNHLLVTPNALRKSLNFE